MRDEESKMRISQILLAREAINSIDRTAQLDVKLVYTLTKFLTKTQNDYNFYISCVQDILNEYSEIAEDGRLMIVPERIDDFNRKMRELENLEVEDPGIRFALSDLSNELKLSMKQIFPLLDFIDEDK